MKLTIIIGLSLGILNASVLGFLILKEPLLRKGFIYWVQSLFITPDWKIYQSPNEKFSLESPFPIEWEQKEYVHSQDIDGWLQQNRSGFSLTASFSHFINPSQNPCLDNLGSKFNKTNPRRLSKFRMERSGCNLFRHTC